MKVVLGPTSKLLDEFIAEIDKMEKDKRRENSETTQREAVLTAAGENIQTNAPTRNFLTGKEDACNSSRKTPRKRQLNEKNEWYEVLELELLPKQAARDEEVHLRREELELAKDRWKEDKNDRKHH